MEAVREFLKNHLLAVIATSGAADTAPESALVAFVEDKQLCLYFQTGQHTRKAKNLVANPKVSLIIGLDLAEKATLQYEGVAEQLRDPAAIAACKQRFAVKNSPTTPEYLDRPDTILYKVTPTWIRFADYKASTHPPVIELTEFDAS